MSGFLVTVLAILVGLVASDQCPPVTLTRPCVCETAGGLTLNCENIKSKDVLEGVFRRTGSVQFKNFQLGHSAIASIPARNSLVPKRFNSITVADSNLTTLFDSNPDSGNVIAMLSLENVAFQGRQFPWTQLRNLKTLKYLNVFGVDIPSLDATFKNNVNTGLKLLMLQKTKTSHLADGVFSQFKTMNDLRIENGGLKEISRSCFPRPSNFGYLGLDYNQITSLPNDIFVDMPSLRIVSLRGNKLSSVPEAVFGGVFNQLITLGLRGNPIECGCTIRWIASKQKPRQLDGRCSTPQNLKNKLITELQPNDFADCT